MILTWKSAIVGLIAAALLSSGAAARDPVVRLDAGAVAGTTERDVNVFLGIPYAAPPVGELRWRDPQPVEPWSGVRDAKRFAPACTQDDSSPSFGPYTASFGSGSERSEDCLYLNVWAPTGKAGKRPVYVFIHGGAYQAGSGSVPVNRGDQLARKGAVVVTINYRLGMLGFFTHPDLNRESRLGVSGNYGILDAIAALYWVRSNAAKFGGDPSNVTIAGQSAGAGIANALLFSPLAEGLFHRAVLQSGPALGIPVLPLEAAMAGGRASEAKAKVEGISGLRAIPAIDLKQVALAGFPIPVVDGKIITENFERPDAKIVSKVPVIIGYTRNEAPDADAPQTVAAFEAEVRKRFGALAERVLALYPNSSDVEAARSAARLARERRVAGLVLWAERRAAEGVPVYAYHFERTYPGADPDRFGAFHSSEIPYVFGRMNLPDADFTAEDRAISKSMQQRWLAFMRTGQPNVGKHRGWEPLTGDPASIWRIDPVDSRPLLAASRLELFREYEANGGSLGLF